MSRAEGAVATSPARSRRFVWTSALLFTVLTGVLFWRYALGLSTTVSDPGDPLLLIWVMEWVERALVHSPMTLFSAPMFHPFPDTLGYTDPVVPHALVALPLRLVGVGPLAAYNAVYLAGIAGTGVLASVLFLELSGSESAALVAAAAATFPAIRLFQLAHVALQVTVFWPLTFLLVRRVLTRPSWGLSVLLSASLVLAALGSLYFGLFLAFLLPPFVLVSWAIRRPRSLRALVALGASAFLAGILFLPVARVYARAPAHLAQGRGAGGFSDLADYLGISPFADVSRWLPGLVVRGSSPEWVGGGAVLVVFGLSGWLVLRGLSGVFRRRGERIPAWAREALPYLAVSLLAVALSLGPTLTWHGHPLAPNPLGFLVRLPGASSIRDFQRAGFAVAFGASAVLAVCLGELARRRPRAGVAALVAAGATTLAPVFSSTLPQYRPPPIGPVYEWIREQPEPFVLYEVPLRQRSELEPLLYLWTSAHHGKRIVHGFSGYLPLTDDTLRSEAVRAYRTDFFTALAQLGTTHLLVHTRELLAQRGGEASLALLHEVRGADRVAVFGDEEVYRVPPVGPPVLPPPDSVIRPPMWSKGGVVDPQPRWVPAGVRECTEVGGSAEPLVLVTRTARPFGISFFAQSELGRLDDALGVEASEDLRTWRPVGHGPLLSTSLAAYVRRPTPALFTPALFTGEAGPFVRFSGRPGFRLRLCGIRMIEAARSSVELLAPASLAVRSAAQPALAELSTDGKLATRWHSGAPQVGTESLQIRLGSARRVVAVVLELGEAPYDWGRRLALDCVEPAAFEGPEIEGDAVLFERPSAAQVLPFRSSQPCQTLRVRQTGNAEKNFWSVAEVGILASSGDAVPGGGPAN